MTDIPVLDIDEKIAKATNSLAENMDKDITVLKVDPPVERNEGMEAASEFLESVHFLDVNKRLLRSNDNQSPLCGMEMWYEDNMIKFMFQTPSEELAQEYRQQLSGYYDGCDISEQTDEEGMFVKTSYSKNDAVAVTDLYLKKHYFNPPAHPNSDSSEIDTDPYKRIINEMDTKDDTRVIFQVLYKPVPYSWTKMNHETIETYADKVQEKGGFETRWFGFKIDEVDDTGIWESAASEIRSRINEPAFFVNIRLAVVCRGQTQEQSRRKAKSRASTIVNSIKHLYKTKSGQKIVPRSYKINRDRNAKETLINMIKREPTNMRQERRIHQLIWEKLTPRTSTIILTSDELAGIAHLPSNDDLSSAPINWIDSMVDGEVPADGDDFEPVGPDSDIHEEYEDLDEYEVNEEEASDEDEDEENEAQSSLFDEG